MLKMCLLGIPSSSLFYWAGSLQWRTSLFSFSRFTVSITNLSMDFKISENLFYSLYFEKNFQFPSFICHKLDSAISETFLVSNLCGNWRSKMFYKIGFLKNFAKFAGKHQYRSLFFNILEAPVQVWLLWSLKEYIFYRVLTPATSNLCGDWVISKIKEKLPVFFAVNIWI